MKQQHAIVAISMPNDSLVACPSCAHQFAVTESIASKIRAKLSAASAAERQALVDSVSAEKELLGKARREDEAHKLAFKE